jgi:hypothetical protein
VLGTKPLIPEGDSVARRIIFYGFQLLAAAWAVVVLLRTVDLGWSPFAGIGLGMFGAIPIAFLGMRINSKGKKPLTQSTSSEQ